MIFGRKVRDFRAKSGILGVKMFHFRAKRVISEMIFGQKWNFWNENARVSFKKWYFREENV